MKRSLAVRMQALLLATGLVVSGIVLPLVDGIVFHGPRPAEAGPVRWERPRGGVEHALECALTQAFESTQGPAAVGAPTLPDNAPQATALPTRASVPPPSAPPGTLQLSRAPPPTPPDLQLIRRFKNSPSHCSSVA
ncbi:MAG TPA: hypothetical protein VH438_09125 [Gemmatimonadales bacterium]